MIDQLFMFIFNLVISGEEMISIVLTEMNLLIKIKQMFENLDKLEVPF